MILYCIIQVASIAMMIDNEVRIRKLEKKKPFKLDYKPYSENCGVGFETRKFLTVSK